MIYVHRVSPENMPPLALRDAEGEPQLLAIQSVEGEPLQVWQTQSLHWGRHQQGADPSIKCPMEPRKLICVETSMSQDFVVEVTSFRLSIDDEQGLPPEWLIKGNDGCVIVAVGMLTCKPQCGEDTCGITLKERRRTIYLD